MFIGHDKRAAPQPGAGADAAEKIITGHLDFRVPEHGAVADFEPVVVAVDVHAAAAELGVVPEDAMIRSGDIDVRTGREAQPAAVETFQRGFECMSETGHQESEAPRRARLA